jgi:hypothetical protein
VLRHSSTLVASNLPFNEWPEAFDSERLTEALLDRLTNHVQILDLNGKAIGIWVKIQLCRSMFENLSVVPRPQTPERSGEDGAPDDHNASQDKSQHCPAKMEGQSRSCQEDSG